jgi:hypothetical protein
MDEGKSLEEDLMASSALVAAVYLIFYGIGIYVAWKFYRALARIGEELSSIKATIRDGQPRLPG